MIKEKLIISQRILLALAFLADAPFSRPLWPEDWEGAWTLVLFDIKEVSRRIRDGLRRFLKALGFGMYQRSVWIFSSDSVEKPRGS